MNKDIYRVTELVREITEVLQEGYDLLSVNDDGSISQAIFEEWHDRLIALWEELVDNG
jgi:hypothetical protein